MATPVKVLGISGSLRKASYNTRLLEIAAGMLPEVMTLDIYDLSAIPMYNPDLEAQGLPAPVEDFRTAITNADALLIATPEYNYSVTGALKNAIDWASRAPRNAAPGTPHPLFGKPLAIMGAGGISGTGHSQMHLRQIASHLNMHTVNKPEVLIVYARQKFDQDGNLNDPMAVKMLGELLTNLASWTRTLRGETHDDIDVTQEAAVARR